MTHDTSLDSLFQLVHIMKRQVHDHIEQLGLPLAPMHIRAIKIIERKSPCTANDIVQFLQRDKAQVTRLLNTLIEQGYIEKAPNPDDKRSQRLLLTDNGMSIMAQINDIDKQMGQQLTQGVTSEDLAALQRITEKMAANLR
ncbi:MarR family transcriptional regulator [Photobacterium japonica]|uniref:MarR family winged helix-turn-helix transcriptional regulator n=1 Tax=Photobacterium japonica TaxID=2910235 RepID=UPI003D0B60F5